MEPLSAQIVQKSIRKQDADQEIPVKPLVVTARNAVIMAMEFGISKLQTVSVPNHENQLEIAKSKITRRIPGLIQERLEHSNQRPELRVRKFRRQPQISSVRIASRYNRNFVLMLICFTGKQVA